MATVDVADTEIMAAAPDDWRRRGQEDYLLSLELTWKRYQALSAEWEHEHCAFCFQKFTDPAYGPQTSQAADDAAHDQTHAGYTNLQAPTARAGRWWICARCFEDLAPEFDWSVVDGDPNAWPYVSPEPEHRPTATDYDSSSWTESPTGRSLKRPE